MSTGAVASEGGDREANETSNASRVSAAGSDGADQANQEARGVQGGRAAVSPHNKHSSLSAEPVRKKKAAKEYCKGCGEHLSIASIRQQKRYHPYCRSSSSSSSPPAPAPIPAIVVAPVTPAIVPALTSSVPAKTAPSRSHHSSKEYCIACHCRLSRPSIRASIHKCDSCRGPHIAHPPSSPLSSPSPPPPPSPPPAPLFDRLLHSHLPLTPIERSAAVVLTRIGETQQEAAERLGTTRQTVSHWQHTFEETREVEDAARRGRPRETSEDENISIVGCSVVDHYLTPHQIVKEVNLDISARTVDRRLQEAGLFGRVALKKRKFDEEEKKQRLSFAEGYKHWTKEDWERVIFADEAIIEGIGGTKSGRQWV